MELKWGDLFQANSDVLVMLGLQERLLLSGSIVRYEGNFDGNYALKVTSGEFENLCGNGKTSANLNRVKVLSSEFPRFFGRLDI